MSADQQKVVGRFLVLWTVAMCLLGAGIATVGDALSATFGVMVFVVLIGLGGIVAASALWVLQREPSAPPTRACAYCGEDGEFSVHRDGFGEGPEVPLCREHGASPSPSLEEIWARTSKNQRTGV